MKSKSRRTFIAKSSAAVAGLALSQSALSYQRIMGSNDRINVGILGLGRRWQGYLSAIERSDNNVSLGYVCDPMQSQLDNAGGVLNKRKIKKTSFEKDCRKVFEDQSIDAVLIATPDHWHAPGTLMASAQGKHVYVEKPCSHNPREGELMIAAQKKYGNVIQMGNQQRSAPESIDIISRIHNGEIGEAYLAVAYYSNGRGEVPNQKKEAPPEGLDWDLWQGPAVRRLYTHNTWDYNWHWYGWDYGTAETGNNATHELDVARWALQVEFPNQVNVDADKMHFKNDGWTMYDSMDATFKFDGGKTIKWDGKSRNGMSTYGGGRGTLIYGTEGSVYVDRGGYKLFDRGGKLKEEVIANNNEGGVQLGGGGDMTTRHVSNFFNTIRGTENSRSPINEGHISTMLGHLANISYRIGESFECDNKTGMIYNRKGMELWSREYEPGWELSV